MPSSQQLRGGGSLVLPVQTAMYNLLTANATLMGIVTGVFDDVADGQLFPYVTLDNAIETPFLTQDHLGRNILATLDVWSRYHGWSETLRIVDLVVSILDNAALALANDATVWQCKYDDMHTLRDPDGETRHAKIVFRVGAQF